MNCKKCNNALSSEAKFCGKCGERVVDVNSDSDKTSWQLIVEIVRKLIKAVLVIFFMSMTSAVSSAQGTAKYNWMNDIYSILTIVSVVTFFVLLHKWWKNRKNNNKWFGWRWIMLLSALSIVSFSVLVFSRALVVANEKALQNPDTKADYISRIVKGINEKMSFPSKINGSTEIIGITAEMDAIRYHYLLSDTNVGDQTNESLKNSLISSICQSGDSKDLFDKGIAIEFIYEVKNSQQSNLVRFTKSDCQK